MHTYIELHKYRYIDTCMHACIHTDLYMYKQGTCYNNFRQQSIAVSLKSLQHKHEMLAVLRFTFLGLSQARSAQEAGLTFTTVMIKTRQIRSACAASFSDQTTVNSRYRECSILISWSRFEIIRRPPKKKKGRWICVLYLFLFLKSPSTKKHE